MLVSERKAPPTDGGFDSISWTAAESPFWRAALAVCAFSAAMPFWRAEHLPICDLPEHLANIATLTHWSDPAWRVKEHFVFAGAHSQYFLYYLVCTVLAAFLGAALANVVLLSAIVLALPYSFRALLRALKRDERLALFACALTFNAPLVTGFFNYVAALPIAFYALALVVRQCEAPTRRRAAGLAALGVAAFYCHVSVFLFLVVGSVVLVVIGPRSDARALRKRVWRLPEDLLWLAPAGVAGISWVGGGYLAGSDLTREASSYDFEHLGRALARLPEATTNVWRGSRDEHGALALVAAACVLAWPRAGSGDDAATSRRRSVIAALALFAAALYFVFPEHVGPGAFMNERYGIVALLLAPGLLRVPRGLRGALPLFLVGATSLYASWNATTQFRAFDVETGSFDAVIAQAKPGKRMLGLMFDPTSSTAKFPPYLHFASYYRARSGGVTSGSFSELSHSPIRFRSEAAPPRKKGKTWEWHPCLFRNAEDGPYYDYVLTRGTIDPFANEPAGPRWRLVMRDGPWALFEKTNEAPWPEAESADAGPCGG